MSCGKHFDSGSCVCDVLAQIAAEQTDHTTDCLGSCSQSIRELMGGVAPSNFNTVPVQLICNTSSDNFPPGPPSPSTCGTVFQATGYRRNPTMPNMLERATSTFFRVDSIDVERGCAVLELLCADVAGGKGKAKKQGPENGEDNGNGNGNGACPEDFDVVFLRTGICITIDCTCFCGIVCLPAMSLQRA